MVEMNIVPGSIPKRCQESIQVCVLLLFIFLCFLFGDTFYWGMLRGYSLFSAHSLCQCWRLNMQSMCSNPLSCLSGSSLSETDFGHLSAHLSLSHSLITPLSCLSFPSFFHSVDTSQDSSSTYWKLCKAGGASGLIPPQRGYRSMNPRCPTTHLGLLGLPLLSERCGKEKETIVSVSLSALWKILISLQVLLLQGFSKHSFSFLPCSQS